MLACLIFLVSQSDKVYLVSRQTSMEQALERKETSRNLCEHDLRFKTLALDRDGLFGLIMSSYEPFGYLDTDVEELGSEDCYDIIDFLLANIRFRTFLQAWKSKRQRWAVIRHSIQWCIPKFMSIHEEPLQLGSLKRIHIPRTWNEWNAECESTEFFELRRHN